MNKLIIKNGLVFDPINGIEGENKDILIENGKIVENFSNQNDIETIDASNKTVIPAGIDMHSHFLSQQASWIRLLGNGREEFKSFWNNWTLKSIVEQYIKQGYTLVIDANIFPINANQAVFNFKHLPVLDAGFLLNISNLWTLELEFQRGMIEEATIFLSDLLERTKAFGFKVYNPFECENWNYRKLRNSVEEKGRLYNFAPIEIYKRVTEYAEYLGLPHSTHAHIEGYESELGKDNLLKVLNEINSMDINSLRNNNVEMSRSQIFHVAHAASYAIDGNNDDLIDFYNKNKNFDLDLGFLSFDPINPLLTSDRRLIISLMELNNEEKIFRNATEFEGDSFATFRKFSKENKKNCILWANAIDLALNIEDKWQVQLTFNYPNYSNISDLPKIAGWLLSNSVRQSFINEIPAEIHSDLKINQEEKTLTFNEFIILSRASPAKSLGIDKIKGNLGPGADGDINILDIDFNKIDPEKDHEAVEKALSNIEYVIKGGKIVKQKDKINLEHKGKLFWTSGNIDSDKKESIMRKKREFYNKFYSIFYDTLNVSIENDRLRKV